MIASARRLLAHPPRLWAPLLAHRLRESARGLGVDVHDSVRSTYGRTSARLVPRLDARVLADPPPAWLPSVCDLFLDHRFPWLGRDWRDAGFAAVPPGLAGHRFDTAVAAPAADGAGLADRLRRAVRGDALARWRMIDWPYAPIDWQRDGVSGYRWREGSPSARQPVDPAPGADVKQPWELGRLQHLPLLALAHAHARGRSRGLAEAALYVREFRNVVLDFIASNPPRHGIQWRCAMDVGIRVANLLLAWDLMQAGGARFDAAFESVLASSVADHARHLWLHPEKRPDFAANHYLADMTGLLFAACYLPGHAQARRWRRRAASELLVELRRQFLADGANFEASVGYHRLSGEMGVYAVALLLGERWPDLDVDWAARLIGGIADFTRAVTRPDGTAAPVGDLDSGRFMRLSTGFSRHPETARWVEQLESHRHLVAACEALGADADPSAVEPRVLGALAAQARLPSPAPRDPAETRLDAGDARDLDRACDALAGAAQSRRYEFALAGPARTWHAFRAFGLFVVCGPDWHLTIRCGAVGQEGAGGHAHNDQLSLTLHVAGETVLEDPGVFVYGALPEQRNAYRSVSAHFAPRPKAGEPGDLSLGLFRLGRAGEGRCLWFGPAGFAGEHSGFGFRVARVVRWDGMRLSVHDLSFGAPLVDLMPAGHWQCPVAVSRRYGAPEAA
ncbi:MAG: heparinase II/III family protein [Burkholderiales bacterium]|nr:heparinase II/III family protein [Burkholderiales bacterium]